MKILGDYINLVDDANNDYTDNYKTCDQGTGTLHVNRSLWGKIFGEDHYCVGVDLTVN